MIAGFALQAAALGLGRLVVIEPVLASGLLFALVLAARRDQRPLRPAEWAAALAVVAGLGVFLTAGQPAGGQRTASAAALGVAVAAAAGLIGLCALLAGRLPASRRALLLGVGGGAAAGVTDALIKSVAVLAAGHLLALSADARLYLLIVIGLLTFTIQQNGYRASGLAAFLPAFTVTEPVIGSLLGLIIYHERLSDGPGQIAVELAACAAVIWGIARLARSGIVSGALPAAGPASSPLAGLAVPVGPIAVSGADEGLLVASATMTSALNPAEHRVLPEPGGQPGKDRTAGRRLRWPRTWRWGRQRPAR